MKITKAQLKQIIKEELQKTLGEAAEIDYYELGFSDGEEGKEKYSSAPEWEDEEFDKPNYDAGYEDAVDRLGFVGKITHDVAGSLEQRSSDSDWYSEEFETLADRKYADR